MFRRRLRCDLIASWKNLLLGVNQSYEPKDLPGTLTSSGRPYMDLISFYVAFSFLGEAKATATAQGGNECQSQKVESSPYPRIVKASGR